MSAQMARLFRISIIHPAYEFVMYLTIRYIHLETQSLFILVGYTSLI